MSKPIAFPFTADLQACAVQGALLELADDHRLLLSAAMRDDDPIPGVDLRRVVLALCCVLPGSEVEGVVLTSTDYLLADNLSEPMVMLVKLCSSEGVTDLEWPLCAPGPHWTSEAVQHAAATAFMASLNR